MAAIQNRYEFVILFDVENGNPNGDPDAGNMPRIDPETGYGLVTDVCLKRKIRNYVETVKEGESGYRIYVKDNVPLNRSDAEACAYLGVDPAKLKEEKKKDAGLDEKIRDFMCSNFFDIRTFGAVMTTFVKGALNCGQVRGPVQLGFARSVDPILPQEVTITRVAITKEDDAEKKGRLENGRLRVSFVPFASRSYQQLLLTVSQESTQISLEEELKDEIYRRGGLNIYRVIIQGERPAELLFIPEKLKQFGNVTEVLDESRPMYDLEALQRQYSGTLIGDYITYFLEKDRSIVEDKALYYGLQALLQTSAV